MLRGAIMAVVLFSYSLANAQTLLQGTLRDQDTGEPVVAATIQSEGKGTLSDLEGNFELLVPQVDTILVLIKYVGYRTWRQLFAMDEDTIQMGLISLVTEVKLMNEVTVTTGKFEKPLSESTVSIEILKPALLEQTNTTSIDDVLDKVPGVAIIDGQANIRGGSGFSYGAGSRVMLLLDDIPALQADAGFPTWDDFPVENIAQMEIVKGATSALYGSSALNGIINVRTGYATEEPSTKFALFGTAYLAPRDQSRKWWSRAPLGYGFSARDARRLNKVDLVNSLYVMDQDSYNFENYDRHRRFTSKLRYRPSRKWEVGGQLNYNQGENQSFFFWKDHEAGAYQGDSSNYSTSDFRRFFIDPFVKYFSQNGNRHELKARFFDVKNQNNANRSNESSVYYLEYQHVNRISSLDAVLTVGAVGIHTTVNAELYSDTTFSSDNLAAYLQIEKKFANRLTVNTGVRYEQNILNGPTRIRGEQIPSGVLRESKPVFRLGLNYQLAEGTFLRASWGQGYRYPTIAERYISTAFGPTIVSPNLQLESETGWSAEVGIKQGFEIGAFQGLADLSLYWSEYQNMMEFVFTGLIDGFQSQNIGDTRISGLDFSLNAGGKIWGLNTNVLAGYTYVDPIFQDFTELDSLRSSADFNILKYRSKHQFKIDLQTGSDKLQVGVSTLRTSEMVAIDAIFALFVPGLPDFRQSHKGYTLTSVRATYHFTPSISCTLLLNNVFNTEYSVRPGLLDAPRNLTLRFNTEL